MVFGLHQDNGMVYAQTVPNAALGTLLLSIESWVENGSTIVIDGYEIYKHLAENYNHIEVDPSKDVFVKDGSNKIALKVIRAS